MDIFPAALRTSRRLTAALGVGLLGFIMVPNSHAQVVTVPSTPVVGSSNPATAEPPVSRPSTEPCIVTLFSNEEFGDYSAHAMSYAPPAACPGPWSKVVLTIDFTVTAGRQYDRTAALYLGNANIYYGTTAEPRATLSPSWHVERDVTDLTPVFKTAEAGQAVIYNIVNSTYTGIIYATAKLYFYPANFRNPPAVVPQVVIPVSGSNNAVALNTGSDQVTATFTAPRNTIKAYLDVISQSQGGDEFWYQCVPNNVTGPLESCGNTAFRETEITIDGKPAGVAPVYPWIYTGGIDPYLWEPITGVQTLNFKPYRVDLTPFAGVLSDGNQHTIGISVYNANNYFWETSNLLLYTDPFRSETRGALLENTLSPAPTPVISENLTKNASGDTVGTVSVDSVRNFTLRGYVESSFGHVETTVNEKVHFNSTQTFDVAAAGIPEVQNGVQTTTVSQKTTEQAAILRKESDLNVSFPLTVNYSLLPNPDGTFSQIVSVDQGYNVQHATSLNGFPTGSSNTQEEVKSSDTSFINSSFTAITGHTGAQSSASYIFTDSRGDCYSRQLTSANNVLSSVTDGKGCAAHIW
ncbi:MAG TPA: peptide-N4-asparagine amidase [Acidobacteriaceae bacterium]|nr:peptide-N4-asparagine amidase [Acidobacteriaceae bacterium]